MQIDQYGFEATSIFLNYLLQPSQFSEKIIH